MLFLFNYLKHRILDWARYKKNLYTNERVKLNINRFKKSKNKKDRGQIIREMNGLKEYWGDIPLQYITHDFYDKNCTLSLEEMKEYIPGYFFYHVIYPKYDNLKKVSALVENKIKAYFLFKELGYTVVEPLLLTKEGCYDPIKTKYYDKNELTDWLTKSASPKIFIKPVAGRGGKGIVVAHKIGNKFLIGDLPLDLYYLKNLKGRYILEPGIIQSSYVNSVYPNSVNTLRIITKRDQVTSKVEIVAITLRMGCDGREVDNSSQGGLLMGINIETGHSIYGYAVYEYGSERFYKHPDSGYEFLNFYIRDWPKFRKEVMLIAEKMKEINLAGWDIAITDDGPVVIETNIQFGIDHTQSGVGGLKKYFINGSPKELLR